MQVHSISLNDFSDNNYHLIGIHSALEDYRLAYMLNLHLNLDLNRSKFDLDFKNEKSNASYSLYEYINETTDNYWYLISNIYKAKIKSNNTSLFLENETSIRLIPEKKGVDFFLKIEGNFNDNDINRFIDIINKIPQIITSYKIDTNKLKSKEVLIF